MDLVYIPTLGHVFSSCRPTRNIPKKQLESLFNLKFLSQIILEMEGETQWESFKYLGVPIFKSKPKPSHWSPVIDKIKTRIQAWGASWLNLAGKLVLLNSVLASIPIYQSSIMLAPSGFISQIESLLRRFLWKGGNHNENKLPLVSWGKVTKPYSEGGLQIRDLRSQNLALGAKLLWKLVSGKLTWRKNALWKKYYSGARRNCLNTTPKVSKGSPIFTICQKASGFFNPPLTWIPGNGENILIWEDSILGEPPLDSILGTTNIKNFLHAQHLLTIWDISKWHSDETKIWKDWNLPRSPSHLHNEETRLITLLQGKSPIATNKKDRRGWGHQSGTYTVSEGYKLIKANPYAPPNPALWKEVWRFKCIPKIDMFIWTLAHNAILTGDNLKKKGWEGPTHCPFCVSKEETVAHILLNCSFAREVWNLALAPWTNQVPLPDEIPNLLLSWQALCPFSLTKKDRLKSCWGYLPKFICWKIWLERNARIFKGKTASEAQVIAKAKAMMGDFLSSIHLPANKGRLTPNEEDWLSSLIPSTLKVTIAPEPPTFQWEIRLDPSTFTMWRKSLQRHSLFFDGASKGNPGEAGGGGVIIDPEEIKVLSYSWGIDKDTNNIAEALALWQGLSQAQIMNITDLNVFGDSRIIIQALSSKNLTSHMRLRQILKKIKLLMTTFQSIQLFHILRELNGEADKEANKAVLLSKGFSCT
jgi:ribonuclease HI